MERAETLPGGTQEPEVTPGPVEPPPPDIQESEAGETPPPEAPAPPAEDVAARELEGITSIKNAIVDELRVGRGLSPMEGVTPESMQGWLDTASDKIAEDHSWPNRLVDEIRENPRNLEPKIGAKPPETSRAQRKAEAKQRIDAAWANFSRVATGKLFANPLDPELIGAAVEVTKAYIDLGVVTFSELMAKLSEAVGERAAHARDSFRAAWDQLSETGEIPAVDIDPTDLGELSRFAKKITRHVVQTGITEREDVVDAVHEELQRIVPDISRRQTMDAMSGYGQYRELSKDDISAKVRDISGQLQQLAKLEDMKKGKAPRKTGVERRTPSDEERRLIKQVNEAKKEGGFSVASHLVIAVKALPAMFKAFKSKGGEFVVTEELRNRPNAHLYDQAKLAITVSEGRLSKQEEAYMGRWSKNFPGVAASERAYVAFLNRMRADVFDALVAALGKNGKVTLEEAKAIANFVNVTTGRGSLGKAEVAAVPLATVFFSPRYVASRFQILAGQPFWKGNARTRKAFAQEYARALMGLGSFYGMIMLAGLLGDEDDEKPEIEFDPRSEKFGKVRFGNTRVDPLAGLSQATVLLTRLGMGETKNYSEMIVPIRGPNVPRNGMKTPDVISRFLRTKLSPWLGSTIDFLAGENVGGEEVTPSSLTAQSVVPLSMRDVYGVLREQGLPRGAALSLLTIFGMGLQSYENPSAGTPEADQLILNWNKAHPD